VPSPETVELRARTDGELSEDLDEAHQALFNLRFQAATHQMADVKQVGKARRRIARIRTLLRERDILAELDAEGEAEETATDDDEAIVEPAATDEAGEDQTDEDETDEDEADEDEADEDEADEDEADEDEADSSDETDADDGDTVDEERED